MPRFLGKAKKNPALAVKMLMQRSKLLPKCQFGRAVAYYFKLYLLAKVRIIVYIS